MAPLVSRLSASIYEGIFRGLARRNPVRPRPIRLGNDSRILVFTCAGIGDTLTDSVVFKALRETFPQAHLAAVVHRRRRLLLEHNPCVNQIFLFHKGFPAFLRLKKELRRAGPWDAILQLRGNDPEPRCLSYLLDPGVTVSVPNMTHLDWLCGHHVPQPDWDQTHGVEQTLRIARHVGADTHSPHLVYDVKPEEKARLEEKLAEWKIDPAKPRLVMQLGGGRRASWRDWPMARYAELLRLEQNLDAEIFVLGGEDQTERRDELARLFAGEPKFYHDAVNRFSLAESAALLASARALVSTDTGIMHLGFAVGTRVIALIHCNNPASRVGPFGYGDRHRVVQLPRPAGYEKPGDADMADISAATVFAALQEVWERMNFPGLDPAWSGLHHALHGAGLLSTWSLEECRAGLSKGEKVLVVATTALGDSLLTTPLIETLSAHLGPERVSLLVKTPYAELYRNDPRIGHVFTVRGKYRWENLRADLQSNPHRIALLANMTEPDLVPWLRRCGVRGFLRYRSRWTRFPRWMANRSMLRKPGVPDYASGHAIENNLAMAQALGLSTTTHRLALPSIVGSDKRNMVLIHPGASRANKRWPAENWARLGDEIAGKCSEVRIVITGDRREMPLADEVIRLMKHPAESGAGKSLRELATAQKSAVGFISGDTGPYHLAVAVDCPTLTLFAPTDRGSSVEACGPHEVDPTRHRVVQTAKFGDSVATISFDQVWKATGDWLQTLGVQ